MRKVIGIGETVLDIIFRDSRPVSALPGGSVYNGMVSLGRAGIPAMFIGEVGNDRIGQMTVDFLRKNNVNTDYVNMFNGSKSPVSLAFLDNQNNADYIFYKDHQHDRMDYISPEINADDIVMMGSYYAINPVIRPQVVALLNAARSKGAIIYYDVNFRSSHINEVMKLTPNILENYEYADIVRGSSEDFETLYKLDGPDRVYNAEISFYCKKFIYTSGNQPVQLRADQGFSKAYPVDNSHTVSTIGAGDNFNAGLVYGLLKYGITRSMIDNGLSEEQWNQVIACAQAFSANCCQSLDNYIDESFGNEMKAQYNSSK